MVIGLAWPVEHALRLIDVGLAERSAQIFEAQSVRCERCRIRLDANRRLLPAADGDQTRRPEAAKSFARASCRQDLRPSVSGSVSEVSASVRIGASAGLTLL